MEDILEIKYIGEWLFAGNLGHFATILSMVAALFAAISFFMAAKEEGLNEPLSRSWQKLGRIGFGVHAFSVIAIVLVLFYLILNHRFEYKYVWQHSSVSLPVHYMISCFWEGQEGSFLLWQFWTAALGLVLMRTARLWENRVMTTVSLLQIFLAAMLIGIYVLGYKVGSSPFILMRDDSPEMPIFMRANYLDFLTDGRGLNPLLQNYWMVIHPPTLFLGFALTVVPFAYVLAGLWKRNFDNWVQPTLIWSLVTGGVLGIGILMGGAWAYEALSFGGFWAWDPVENASFVPWLTLVGGIHTLLAYRHTGHALRATNFLLALTFMLVLYSTFLTRSGILGDTSVHSFTDLGMSGQLLAFMLAFLFLSAGLLAYGWKSMPSPPKEEATDSREFWMFVGSLVLLLAAALITLDTSWPVVNKIFGTKVTITEPVAHYNRYMVWFATVVATLTAIIQFLRYKKTGKSGAVQKLTIPTLVALGLTLAIGFALQITHFAYGLMLFATLYTVAANTHYLLAVLSGRVRVAGGSVTHIGFGLLLLGALISAGKQEVISLNTAGIDYGEAFNDQNKRENILLYKDRPIQMGPYWVTYVGDSLVPPNTLYKVRYEKKVNEEDKPTEVFTLYPNAQINPNMGLIANPDTRHYLTKDVFTHVSSVADKSKDNESEQLKEIELAPGDTAITGGSFIILKTINPNPASPSYVPLRDDIAASAQLEIIDVNSKRYTAEPIYYIRNNAEFGVDAEVEAMNMTIKFDKIFPDKGKIKLSVIERNKPVDFIIMKAIIFPYINVLWLGCFIMAIGFFISAAHRLRQLKPQGKKTSSQSETSGSIVQPASVFRDKLD